jgi:lipopolysaccharide transport system ATP-binding protein
MTKVIEINNLSKVYDLGLVGTGTLSKDLNRSLAKMRGKPDPYATIVELNDRTQKSATNMVYALKDINFSVEQGDVLGIIGKNGAGKSTLLKILSQITSPSTGTIKMKGRVASLLEVGTGMHPEMTARQNIYLNGSLMGMRRHEITSKLDEIVDFAGIEKYLDTPTKRFSSGMTVRLGFAIAAFLEPEILVVDEVLAVGDAEFQKKAIGKMQDVSKGEGRTVLFVSHNMAAVKSLCTSAMLIDKGILKINGDTEKVLSHYLIGDSEIQNFKNINIKSGDFEILSVGVRSKSKNFYAPINRDEAIEFVIEYKNKIASNLGFTLKLKGEDGQCFMVTGSKQNFVELGHNFAVMEFPANLLNDGAYYVDLLVVKDARAAILIESDIVSFMANPESRSLGGWMGKEVGYIRGNFKWQNLPA